MAAGLAVLGVVTLALRRILASDNPATAALVYLVVVLGVAAGGSLAAAVAVSLAAVTALNFFFLPPVGTFTITDPQNWIALGAFVVASLMASHLSTSARMQAQEATARRLELARLFDLTRDILLTSDQTAVVDAVARHVARRFELDVVTVCLPSDAGGWSQHAGGPADSDVPVEALERLMASARGGLEFDARTRSYAGQATADLAGGQRVTLAPIRLGTRPIGVLAVGGRPLDPGTADAVAGIVAIAVERAQFFAEREAAERDRQRAELSSALLASLGHDLRTPLTAVRVAVTNAVDPSVVPGEREAQGALALRELGRLGRVLEEILDMARIETGALRAAPEWVTATDVVDAARAHAGATLQDRPVAIACDDRLAVQIDPRLTSAAVAHLIENAAQYSPPGRSIHVEAGVSAEGLRVVVTDEGPGLDPAEMQRLFEPFFRGRVGREQGPGSGMGLSITRGLLAAQGGRIWAENVAGAGARFTLVVPGVTRPAAVIEGAV